MQPGQYRQHHQDEQQQYHGYNDGPGYSDGNAGYLYPPSSASAGNNNEKDGGYELGREHSLGGDTVAGSSMHSPYDEKLAALASASSSDVPAAIPRYPNGRPDNAHNTKSSVSFAPGHLSRGSVALLAAAEGNMQV